MGEEEVSCEGKENPAKTKTCQDTVESSATLTKPNDPAGGKENSKTLANSEDSAKPPLRKTAINPAFLKKSEPSRVDASSLDEDESKENILSTDDTKTKIVSKSPQIKPKKNEKKPTVESPVIKSKRKLSSSNE